MFTYQQFLQQLLAHNGFPFDCMFKHGGIMWMLTKEDTTIWVQPKGLGEWMRTDTNVIEFISGKTEINIIET